MNMTKREKTLVAVVLVLAIFFAYFMFFLKPYLAEMDDLTAQKDNKELLVTTNNQKQIQVNNLDNEIAETEKLIEGYSIGISQGGNQPTMLVFLEDTINSYAQKVMFYFDTVKPVGQLESCPVTITMVATYSGLKNILEAFSDSEYYVKVTSLQTTSASTVQTTQTTEYEVFDPTGTPAVTVSAKNSLDITLTLEFYNLSGEIPANTVYPFDDTHQYGGDIFY